MVEEKRDVSSLSDLSGISSPAIKKNVRIVQRMQENGDDKHSRFSYYEVLDTNRKISAKLDEDPSLMQTLLREIKEERFTAQQLRDRLPTVIAKPRILRKYEKGEISLDDAYDRAKTSGTEKRLKRVREQLDDIKQGDITPLNHAELKAVEQVVRQVGRHLKRVGDIVEAELSLRSAERSKG